MTLLASICKSVHIRDDDLQINEKTKIANESEINLKNQLEILRDQFQKRKFFNLVYCKKTCFVTIREIRKNNVV